MDKSLMEELIEKQLRAYNTRDIEAFCGCYHAEVTVYRQNKPEPVSVGLDRFRKGYSELFSKYSDLHCELKSRIVLGEFVLDEEIVTRQGEEPLHAVAVYGFRDNLIDRIWFLR